MVLLKERLICFEAVKKLQDRLKNERYGKDKNEGDFIEQYSTLACLTSVQVLVFPTGMVENNRRGGNDWKGGFERQSRVA